MHIFWDVLEIHFIMNNPKYIYVKGKIGKFNFCGGAFMRVWNAMAAKMTLSHKKNHNNTHYEPFNLFLLVTK